MAEHSGFFDAHLVGSEYDRVYLAESFAKYFASFIGNGIFGGKSDELIVYQSASVNMGVRVLPGQGWINGYWYENTSDLPLTIDLADGVYNRIDIIVLKWGKVEREVWLEVKKGTPAANAVAPTLSRNSDYYELKLAEVHVDAGATSILQSNIVDTRLNSDVCGLVVGVVQQFDTTAFGAQLNSFIADYIDRAYNDYLVYQQTIANHSTAAGSDYESFRTYLNTKKDDVTQAVDSYMNWLASKEQLVNTELNSMLAEFRSVIDTSYQEGVNTALSRAKESGEFDGATFTPHVSDEGVLSWENDKGLENPAPRNITGPIGLVGPQGPQGEKGEKGEKGDTYTLTVDDKADIANVVLASLPTWNGGSY